MHKCRTALLLSCFAIVAVPRSSFAADVDFTSTGQSITTIRIGDLAFSAKDVRFETVDQSLSSGRFRCRLQGQAKLMLFAGDIEITAEHIQFEMVGQSPVEVKCTGNCMYKESDQGILLKGDQLRFNGRSDSVGIVATGNATIEYGSAPKTNARAESISIQNQELEMTGDVKIKLVQ